MRWHSKQRAFAGRILGLTISVGLFAATAHRVDPLLVKEALWRMNPLWFLVSLAAFGLATLGMSARWHLMAREAGVVVHGCATWRVCTIGHFFNTLLFGPMGGDTAKTALYYRWFRMPVSKIATACLFDRLLGLLTSVLMGLFLLPSLMGSGLDVVLEHLELRLQPRHIVIVAGAVLGLILWKRFAAQRKSARTRLLRRSIKPFWARLRKQPMVLAKALLLGLGIQLIWCGLLGLNLMALTHAPVPWKSLIWTFPLIGFIASTPFTIAGAGLRETAALFFLGLYAVPAEDIAAASMLTLLVYIVWAFFGGWLFWSEDRRFRRAQREHSVPRVSVIIPTFNEETELAATLERIKAIPEIQEIIVTDGGSVDRTRTIAEAGGCLWIESARGRGAQLKAGTSLATGDVLLFLHADTWLPREAGRAVLDCLRDTTVVGGGFWKVFRDPPLLMRASRFKCASRLYFGGVVLGDQGIFVRRSALGAIGGFPAEPLMEEYVLCKRLRTVGRLALAPATVVTSERRFRRLGVLRTYLRMWRVSLLFHLGVAPERLRQIYESE